MSTNGTQTQNAALKNFIERIERLTEQKGEIGDDIKDVKAEAKSQGFDMKALNEVLKRRKKSKAELADFDSIVAVYESNL